MGNTEGRVAVDEVTVVNPVGLVICVEPFGVAPVADATKVGNENFTFLGADDEIGKTFR